MHFKLQQQQSSGIATTFVAQRRLAFELRHFLARASSPGAFTLATPMSFHLSGAVPPSRFSPLLPLHPIAVSVPTIYP